MAVFINGSMSRSFHSVFCYFQYMNKESLHCMLLTPGSCTINCTLQTGIGMDTIDTKFTAVHWFIHNLRTKKKYYIFSEISIKF